ncbi:MAG: iron ABC transporter permease [Trueperaceae bacterium]
MVLENMVLENLVPEHLFRSTPLAVRTISQSRSPAVRSSAWIFAAFSFVVFLALPFGRPGRPFLTIDEAYRPWNLDSPWLWLVPAMAIMAAIAALLPLEPIRRGNILTAAGATGFLIGVGWLMATSIPFGMGALLSLTSLLIVTGYGLSLSGRIQGDPFIACSILFVGLLIVLLIIYPLLTVLQTAIFIDGRFTFDKIIATVNSPRFLFIENPYTTRDEVALIRNVTIAGAALSLAWLLLRRAAISRVVTGTLVGAILGLALGLALFARGAIVTSLTLAVIVATVATVLGLAFALLGQRTRIPVVRHSMGAISLLPIITPPFILAFAMIFLLGRRGLLTHDILGMSSSWIFGMPGVALAQILAYTPIAYLVIQGSVAGLNAALEEASVTLGASRWHTFRTITWPLVRPGLANAFLLSVIESFADFGNPLILGGDRNYLATEVFAAFAARFDPSEAAVYGVFLLIIVLLVFYAQARWLGQSSFVTVTGKPSRGGFSPLPRALEGILLVGFFLWAIAVVGLYGSIVYGSFVQLWGIDSTLTLQHWRDLANAGIPVFLYTARIAAISAVPAALLGFLIAYLVVRQNFWGRRFLEFGSMLSFATPGTVMGVAYILAFNTGPWLLTATATIIVLAFIFRNMPVAIRGGVAGFAQIDISLEEAATTLGASSSRTLRTILVPLLIIPLIAGLIFAFVRAMTAISQVIFVVSPGNMLTTVLLLGWVEQGQTGRAAAMGTLLIVSMLTVILLLMLLTRRRGLASGEVVP